MNIKKHYNLLIEKRKKSVPEGIVEKHHIVPKCLGGSDDVSNIVSLTPREHFVAHWMLTKIYDDRKIVYAFFCMMRDPRGYRGFNSHYYDRIKRAYKSEQRHRFLTNNPMWNEEARKKVSELRKGEKNPNYQCGANNNTAYPVTVVFDNGKEVTYTHGKAAYEDIGMSRSTWIQCLSKSKFHSRWGIVKVKKHDSKNTTKQGNAD